MSPTISATKTPNNPSHPNYSPWLLRSAQTVIVLLSIALVSWMVWHAFDAVPHADDFCYGVQVLKDGVLGNVFHEYTRWGGRFSSTLLIGFFAAQPLWMSAYLYVVALFILALMALSSSYFLSRLGFQSKALTLLFFIALVAGVYWWEVILWLTGGITYGIGLALLLYALTREITWYTQLRAPTAWQAFALGLLSIVLAGFNETVMVAHVGFLACCLLGCAYHRRSRALLLGFGIVLACALLGALVVALAPGNAVRAGSFAGSGMLLAPIKSVLWFIEQCGMALVVGALFFWCALHLFEVSYKSAWNVGISWELVLFLCISTTAAIFTREYSQGGLGPWRAQSVDFFITTINSFLLALIFYQPNTSSKWFSNFTLQTLMLSLGVIIFLALHPNPDSKWWRTVVQMRLDTGFARHFQSYLMQAYQNPGKDLLISNYENTQAHQRLGKPRTMFMGDFTNDPKDWTNQCFANYYQLPEMRIGPASKP